MHAFYVIFLFYFMDSTTFYSQHVGGEISIFNILIKDIEAIECFNHATEAMKSCALISWKN